MVCRLPLGEVFVDMIGCFVQLSVGLVLFCSRRCTGIRMETCILLGLSVCLVSLLSRQCSTLLTITSLKFLRRTLVGVVLCLI